MAATISTSRFSAISASASVVAEQLGALDDPLAADCHARIVTIHPRLRAERFASTRAMEMLTAAKAAARSDKATVKLLIDGALRVGKIFNWPDVCGFAHQKEATFFTMEGLASALRERGAHGEALSARFTQAIADSEAVATELKRATAEYARATTAFTAEYRALSSVVAFGRAVLAHLGVEVPRIADAKRGITATSTARQPIERDANALAVAIAQPASPRGADDFSVTATPEARPAAANLPKGGACAPTFEGQPNEATLSSPTARCATRSRTALAPTEPAGRADSGERSAWYGLEHGADANHLRPRPPQRPTVYPQPADDRASPPRHRRDVSRSSGDSPRLP